MLRYEELAVPWIGDVQVVVSPSVFGDERKGQDRAAWDPSNVCGCVCDGASGSLWAEKAAEDIVMAAADLFNWDVRRCLAAQARSLFTRRAGSRAWLAKPERTLPDSVQNMLQRITLAKLETSFQTTCVAVRFESRLTSVGVGVVRIGDSSFLAYSPDGQVLWPTAPPDDDAVRRPYTRVARPNADTAYTSERHHVPKRPSLVSDPWPTSLRAQLCVFLRDLTNVLFHWRAMRARSRWTYATQDFADLGLGYPGYASYPRRDGGEPIPFAGSGETTAVLPEAAFNGQWAFFYRQFPTESHFVLASDGFTRCFKDPSDLWTWLQTVGPDFCDRKRRRAIMKKLHARLREQWADDDITFIWIRPPLKARG